MNITFERFKERLTEESPQYSDWAIKSLYRIFSEVCYLEGEFTENEIWEKEDQCSDIGFYWEEAKYLDFDFLPIVGTPESKKDDLNKIKEYLTKEQGDSWDFDGNETFIYFRG
jgi:hypothetical protein